LTALLVLMLCVLTCLQSAHAIAGQNPSAATPTCKCCDYDPAKCATPACCARPSDNRAPVTPAVPRCVSGNEWQAITTAAPTVSTLPRCSVHELPVRLNPFLVGGVAIFQRDCSYLI